jgi:hypothetical protein
VTADETVDSAPGRGGCSSLVIDGWDEPSENGPQAMAATLSDDGIYRYDLSRRWADGPRALWVMLNPSTADARQDDPTIRRCIAFSKREGCGSLTVVNLYAFRSTDPKALLTAKAPIGPENTSTIRRWLADPSTSVVVAAWGAWWQSQRDHPARLNVEALVAETQHRLVCLGTTKKGDPRHPLYVAGKQPFVPFVNNLTAVGSARSQADGC